MKNINYPLHSLDLAPANFFLFLKLKKKKLLKRTRFEDLEQHQENHDIRIEDHSERGFLKYISEMYTVEYKNKFSREQIEGCQLEFTLKHLKRFCYPN